MTDYSSTRYLNLGCGSRFHPDWVNIDFISGHQNIKKHNLLSPLPFEEETFDVIYHSHVLEHFRPEDADRFIGECFRVLRRNGILRVAVPDLELLAKKYLASLECATEGHAGSSVRHQWAIIQLIDQCTRERPGGEMVGYLRSIDQDSLTDLASTSSTAARHLEQRFGEAKPESRKLRFSRLKTLLKAWISALPLGEALRLGRFRMSGEVHKWMYDRVSLDALLRRKGFRSVSVHDAQSSSIGRWTEFHLDTDPDGRVYKPDSLYVEAIRP